MAAKNQLPIPPLLRLFDRRDFRVHRAMSVDEADRKEFERLLGYLLPLWMSAAVDDEAHARLIVRFNRLANEGWFDFRQHPELQAKLLATVGLGKEVRHTFVKSVRAAKYPTLYSVLETRYPDIRKAEVALWCRRNSETDLEALAESMGFQPDDVKEAVEDYRRMVTEQT